MAALFGSFSTLVSYFVLVFFYYPPIIPLFWPPPRPHARTRDPRYEVQSPNTVCTAGIGFRRGIKRASIFALKLLRAPRACPTIFQQFS